MVVAAGATNLYFNRDTKVFIAQGANIWEVPVLNGYAASQGTNTSEVTLSEMSDATGNSRRGRAMFTDSRAPTEWSFDTYVRPFLATGTPDRVRALEEVLWANFVANNAYTAATPAWTAGVTYATTTLDFAFTASNKLTLGSFDIYIVLGASRVTGLNFLADGDTTIYKINSASINEVGITFDIDGIATLSWSGMGAKMQEVTSYNATTAITASAPFSTAMAASNNFIRNKLTVLTAQSSVSGSSKTYDLTLTGGSITLTNNLSYLTPEVLGRVNQPLGHITGTRTVGGSFTVYLDEKTNGSIDLFEDIANNTTAITNSFDLNFYVGGISAADMPTAPGIQFDFPNCHLEVPTHSFDDVVSLEVAFSALPSTISAADEVTKIRYTGIAPV